MKRTILLLTVVSLIAVPAMAVKEPGDVSKPVWAAVPVVPVDDSLQFDWEPGVDGKPAEKYSLDIYGVVLVSGMIDEEPVVDLEVEWSVSFGTSDYNPDNMSDTTITIPLDDIHLAIIADLEETFAEIEIYDISSVSLPTEMFAKVKGLDPSDKSPKKRQNNVFSDPLDLMPHPVL